MTAIEALREAREELVFADSAANDPRAGMFTMGVRRLAYAEWIKAVRQFNESRTEIREAA